MSGKVATAVIIILIIVLLLVFSTQVCNTLTKTRDYAKGWWSPAAAKADLPDESDEHMSDAPLTTKRGIPELPPGQTSDTLTALGYTGGLPWDEVIQASELDPSTFSNHMEFVKDVRQFSSGANFTSVTDDNTNGAFTNFVGLRRPQHVPIGSSARQVPDVDESVLQRNRDFRW